MVAFDRESFGGPSPQLRDVNRDGLPDLVTDQYYTLSNGTLSAIETTSINEGFDPISSTATFGPPTTHGFPSAPSPTAVLRGPQYGDIDGDGLFDTVDYYSTFVEGGTKPVTAFSATVALGDGISLGFEDSFAQQYLAALQGVSPTNNVAGENVFTEDFGYALADINGDGLVDLIRNHANRPAGTSIFPNQGGGQILYNTGQTWSDMVSQFNSWQIPAGSNAIPGVVPSDVTGACGSAFVDLNGDGAVDLIQEDSCNGAKFGRTSWFNNRFPPIIEQFPNGLADPTVVAYVSTAEKGAHTAGVPCDGAQPNAVYCDDDPVGPGTKRMAAPVRVVKKVTMADGNGLPSDTGYAYHSLRTDPNGRGPLGFHRVVAYDHASGIATYTTYSQGYPYTGRPTEVDRFQVLSTGPVQLTGTATQYCDSVALDSNGNLLCSQPAASYPPKTPLFVYAKEVTDTTYIHPETADTSEFMQVKSDFRYDGQGNSTKTTVNTQLFQTGIATQSATKTTVNLYGADGSPQQLQGKPTSLTETSFSAPVGPFDGTTVSHHTAFLYAPASSFGGASSTALALATKQSEPGADWPIELDTAYAYDQFGDIVTTTSCASDFTQCYAGAPGPVGTTDPFHHPPFRTKRVSYSTTDFNAPLGAGLVQTLPYGNGRFLSKARMQRATWSTQPMTQSKASLCRARM